MAVDIWTAVQKSPAAMKVYRSYRRLPAGFRAPARWMVTPRWEAAAGMMRMAAQTRVMSGPFKTMKLCPAPLSSRNIGHYLLGTQELELADTIERIVAKGYATILNIGVAHGYYAVGLALRMPSAQIVGFEAVPELHAKIWEAARLNGVDKRLRLEGLCLRPDLKSELLIAKPRVLVVCDIEGAEATLLDPGATSELTKVDLLIETHDAAAPGCTELLKQRFGPTHRVEVIAARPRTLADFPTAQLSIVARTMPDVAVELMNEYRASQQYWIYATANTVL